MVARWLDLRMLGGDQWILPIWGAANEAAQARRVSQLTAEMGALGLHISIRFDILHHVIQRLNQETAELYEEAKGHKPENVSTPTAQGYVLPVDDELKFRLIADIDAFLFEVNSCWELMRELFRLIRAHVGTAIASGRDVVTAELRAALQGVDQGWFSWLDRQRNFVAHAGTPYLAMDLTNTARWELLVTKEHPTKFADPDRFFRYSEMVNVAGGFNGAKQALQAHLIGLYRAAGDPEVGRAAQTRRCLP